MTCYNGKMTGFSLYCNLVTLEINIKTNYMYFLHFYHFQLKLSLFSIVKFSISKFIKQLIICENAPM